jgi:hypothetical protein
VIEIIPKLSLRKSCNHLIYGVWIVNEINEMSHIEHFSLDPSAIVQNANDQYLTKNA